MQNRNSRYRGARVWDFSSRASEQYYRIRLANHYFRLETHMRESTLEGSRVNGRARAK